MLHDTPLSGDLRYLEESTGAGSLERVEIQPLKP
jgi:hypothetical protein